MRSVTKPSAILITGSTGFIGKNLVEDLKKFPEEFTLFYPAHRELELLDTDKVSKYLKNHKIKVVVHCASAGGSRKNNYDRRHKDIGHKNLKMFFNLAYCLKDIQRMIVLGSGAEYDCRHYQKQMAEDYFGTHIPDDQYGFSKYVISKFIEKSEKIINLRLFGVFGQHESYEYKFISNAIVKNILGLPIVINQNVFFDYLFINDLVKIIVKFLKKPLAHKFYNVTPGVPVDLLKIAREINRLADRPSKIVVKNRGLNTEYSGDNRRLLKELGQFRFTPFEEALEKLYFWYKSIIKTIDKKAVQNDRYIRYCLTKK